MKNQVVTRFAPSPTGYLHVGGARTAFYNWLFARKNGGKFILRIEDTDVARSTEQSTAAIMQSMKWLGMDWDEGPYYQSQRLSIYADQIKQLEQKGWIYPAFETKEELEAMWQQATAKKQNPIYPRTSLKLSKDEVESRIAAGQPYAWRLKVPDLGATVIPELLMGGEETQIANSSISDFIITRPGTKDSPGMPLYNLVCAIDDHLMGITHVIRGVEHFTNAARQVLIHQALGADSPDFVHLPVITKNGKKMSKRDVDPAGRFPVSVLDRKELGYLPEATLNHIALLGWSHPDEKDILEVDEIIRSFSLAALHKSNAGFNEDKYFFLNAHYIAQKSDKELLELAKPYLEKAGLDITKFSDSALEKMIALQKPRIKILSEIPEGVRFFFNSPTEYEEKGLNKDLLRTDHNVRHILARVGEKMKSLQIFDKDSIEAGLKEVVSELGVPFKVVGPAVRVAVTGRINSPALADVIEILGMAETFERLSAAQRKIEHSQAINIPAHLVSGPKV